MNDTKCEELNVYSDTSPNLSNLKPKTYTTGVMTKPLELSQQKVDSK